jgi:Flagellar P-ring protein
MDRLGKGRRVVGVGGLVLGALGVALLALAGCTSPQVRSQSEEDDHDKYDVRTVGDVCTVANADPLPVTGVGLVTGLDGTGGSAPPGNSRTMLEEELKRKGVRNIKELLTRPDTSLVLINGFIPPGARKGDTFDLEITLPPGSKTTSLRGGYLQECQLLDYEHTANLGGSPETDRVLAGHKIARGEGPLMVGFGDGDEASRVRSARVWGGGKTRMERPFYLVLNDKQQFARVASLVADRINEAFHGSLNDTTGAPMAIAKNKSAVVLNVPYHYRLNLPRYLRVVRLIPLRDPTDQAKADAAMAYRRRLEEDLQDPARTVTAALRLEALGTDSVPALKAALASKHPLVRFCAAETLAYLGNPCSGEELASAIVRQPALRAFGLTALASLDEAVCHVKLGELLMAPQAEVRYGAFRGLRALDDRDPAVQGELLAESFWLHQVAPGSGPLVHLTTGRRAEVVLFGEEPRLVPPFSFPAGEYTLTSGNGDEHCVVSSFSARQGGQRMRQCSLKVEEVLRVLAELGAGYPEVVEFVRQAKRCDCVNCPVEFDQMPQAVSVHELARAGTGASDVLSSDEEVLLARPDFGATPTLYQLDNGRKLRHAAEGDDKKADKKSAERRPLPGDE